MKNLIFLILLSVPSVVAKEVYFADADGVKTSETVSSVVKIWQIADYFFHKEQINMKKFGLGIKTSNGFIKPDKDKTIGDFGETLEGPVLFYVVPFEEGTDKLQKELGQIRFASECKPIIKESICPKCPTETSTDTKKETPSEKTGETSSTTQTSTTTTTTTPNTTQTTSSSTESTTTPPKSTAAKRSTTTRSTTTTSKTVSRRKHHRLR